MLKRLQIFQGTLEICVIVHLFIIASLPKKKEVKGWLCFPAQTATQRGERDTKAEVDSLDEEQNQVGRSTFGAEERDDFNRRRRLHDEDEGWMEKRKH